jgi:hypothetical protein
VVDADKLVFVYDFTLAPTVAIHDQGPPDDNARSILKPVSFAELSDQARFIWLEDAAVALRPLGATGIVAKVVALAMSEKVEVPAELNEQTR